MSRSQDHYAPNNQTTAQFASNHNSEPADPDNPDHATRRGLPLAPDSVKTDSLPKPFRADKGGAVSVEEAGEVYLQIQSSNLQGGKHPTKYDRHRYGIYPRILEADRHFQAEFDGLTAVMLTRRLSPLDSNDNWLTPWECNEMLHGGGIHRSVRGALEYHLGNFEYEWIAVTAPTESAGTPHEHIYIWIDDPGNDVTTEQISPALDRHLDHCTNAQEKHHQYRADGTDGAITVQHNPDLIGDVPDEFFSIVENSQTYADTGEVLPNTAGAQYLASQLAHLPMGDYKAQNEEDPPSVLFEGAALAWVSTYNWFRASGGVPS